MKAAFIHDHYFVYNKKDHLYYDGSGGVFDKKLWKRYLEIFNNLKVIARGKNVLPNKLIVSSHPNVSFELIYNLHGGLDRFTKVNKIKKQLTEHLREIDFAIIRLPSILGYIAQDICIRNGIPYTLEIVACPWDGYWNYGKLIAKLIAPVEYLKLKRSAAKADAAIYVTKYFLQRRYPCKCKSVAISNVNIEQIIDKNAKNQFYKKFKVDSTFKIALIGSFHVKYKGHIEALKALHYIINKRGIKNIRLLFVGTGDSKWVTHYAKEIDVTKNVEIVGTLKAGEDGILPFLDSIHLLIHPSKQEGLPRVVIEALSRGRLVLGSNVAGIPELLDKNFLHNRGDWKHLAEQIINLYQSPKDWENITNNNLSVANEYLEYALQERRINYLKSVIDARAKTTNTI